MVGLNVLWMCRVAAQRDSWHAFDSQCYFPCLGVWSCRKYYERGSLSTYMVCCVSAVWRSYGKLRLGVSPFTSSLITIPYREGGLSNANTTSLLAHKTHMLAVSHNPFTHVAPLPPTPCPQHTHNLLIWLSPRETRQWTINLLINTSIN